MGADFCYAETMEDTSADNLAALLELTRVAADVAKAACSQDDFLDSNVLQHSVASALCKTLGLDIRMLRGFLLVNGEKANWSETVTLVCVGDQWLGDGHAYTQDEIETLVKEKCLEAEKDKIAALDAPTLMMEYSILNGVVGMGRSSPELIQTVSNAIEMYQAQTQHDLLQSATTPAEGRLKSRRI